MKVRFQMLLESTALLLLFFPETRITTTPPLERVRVVNTKKKLASTLVRLPSGRQPP